MTRGSNKQEWFFSASSPLEKRLGTQFFKAIPRSPGVYYLRDAAGTPLYVGQSQNLHQRLNSYKNAHPRHTSKRIVRLVHEVHHITWECLPNPQAAIIRENELLRQLKPRFNRANVYPEAYRYLQLEIRDLKLVVTERATPPKTKLVFGAFKGAHRKALAALARLEFRIRTKQPHWWQLPRRLGEPMRSLCIEFSDNKDAGEVRYRISHWVTFFSGSSRQLVDQFLEQCTHFTQLSEFDTDFVVSDLETIERFFILGPRRNQELAAMAGLDSPVIEATKLNDLLVQARETP